MRLPASRGVAYSVDRTDIYVGTDRSARWKRTLVILAVLALSGVALYALAGFLLAPRLIERKLEAMVGQDTGLTLAIETAAVNPFTLTLSLDNVTLFRRENTPVVAVDRIDARIRAASLGQRGWLLRDVVIRRPRVSLRSAGHEGDEASDFAESAPPSADRQPGMIVSMEDALLVQPEADLGNGFAWRAERVTGDARMEYGRGLGITADVRIEALAVTEPQSRQAVLTVPSVIGRGIVLTTFPAAVSVEVAELDHPRLALRRRSTGAFRLPPGLASLLSPAAGGSDTRFEVSDGRVDFADLTGPAPVRLGIDDIAGTATGRRDGGDTAAAVSLQGRLSDAGTGTITAQWQLSRPLSRTRVALDLQRIDLTDISPYVAGALGRRPLAGRMDLSARLRLREAELDLENRLVIEGLRFDEPDGSAIGALPLDTAVALLEDDEGRIAIRVPVAPRRVGAGFDAAGAFSRALAGYVSTLTAAPFEYLAELVGRPQLDLATLGFAPGSAEIREETRAKLGALNDALESRPSLGLTVYPGLDPVADREALARQQIRLHVNLATSTGMQPEAAEKPIDFDDPKVQTVLDEFAGNRLPPSRQAAIADRHPDPDASRYRAVFEALVDNEDVPSSALDRLARYRARSIVEELASSGDDGSRVQLAPAIAMTEPDAGRGGVIRIEVRHHDRSEAAASVPGDAAPDPHSR